jgi:hypothetical protein
LNSIRRPAAEGTSLMIIVMTEPGKGINPRDDF